MYTLATSTGSARQPTKVPEPSPLHSSWEGNQQQRKHALTQTHHRMESNKLRASLLPGWVLRKASSRAEPLPSPLRPPPPSGSGHLAVAGRCGRPGQGVRSQGRGELKYLASDQRELYIQGSGHAGLREEGRGAHGQSREGPREPGPCQGGPSGGRHPLSTPAPSVFPGGRSEGPGRDSCKEPPQLLPPRLQSHPTEFKAWNFSLRFLTRP